MANRYWIGGSGNWSDTANWSATSGGAGGELEPTSSDDVIIDNNSCSSNFDITIDVLNPRCLSFDSSGLTSYYFRFLDTSYNFFVYGNADFSALSSTANSINTYLYLYSDDKDSTVKFRSSSTIYWRIFYRGENGSWTLGTDSRSRDYTYIQCEVFNCGTYRVISRGLVIDNAYSISNGVTVNMGSGTWYLGLSSNDGWFYINDPDEVTLNVQTSSITFTGDTYYINVENKTLQNVTDSTSEGLLFREDATIDELTLKAGNFLKGYAGITLTMIGDFNATGSSGSLISILGYTAGSSFTMTKSSGVVSCDYLYVKDSVVTGGDGWYAGANSTDVSGNTGWIFTEPPIIKGINDTITNSDTFSQHISPGRNLYETITISENYSRIVAYHKIYTETINNVATALKSTARSISETITNSEFIQLSFVFFKTISDTISNIDSVARGTIKNVLDSFTTNPPPTPSETLIDSYSETNADVFLDTNTYVLGNTFTGSGLTLGKIKLWLNTATPSVDGTLVVKIYSVTGTYGTGDCVPDTLLATSDEFDVADMLYTDGTPYLQDFTFSGANIITLGDGTHYAFALETITATDNAVNLGMDFSSPTFDGNLIVFMGSWLAFDIYDTCFYAYSSGGGGETINYIIKSITRNILETITITGEVVRSMIFYRTIADVISTTDNIIKGAIKNVSETITNSEEFLRSFIKNLTETITNTEIFSRLVIYYKTISDTISNSDVVLKSITKNISETITISYTLVKSLAREISDTITNSDIIEKTRIRFKEFIETITFSDSIMYIKKIAEYLFGKITGIMTIGKIKSEDVKSKIDSVNITGKIDKQETNSKIEDINFKGKIK